MRLLDPAALVCDSLSLEATELEGDVRCVFENHVRPSDRSRNILKVLPHEGVATARVGGVANAHLLTRRPSRVAGSRAEEDVLVSLVEFQVLRPEQGE